MSFVELRVAPIDPDDERGFIMIDSERLRLTVFLSPAEMRTWAETLTSASNEIECIAQRRAEREQEARIAARELAESRDPARCRHEESPYKAGEV